MRCACVGVKLPSDIFLKINDDNAADDFTSLHAGIPPEFPFYCNETGGVTPSFV